VRSQEPWNVIQAEEFEEAEALNLISNGAVCAWNVNRGGVVVAHMLSFTDAWAKGVPTEMLPLSGREEGSQAVKQYG